MKLSIFASQLYLDEIADDKGAALEYAKKRGITSVEVFADELSRELTLHDYNKMVKDHGLLISTVIKVSHFPSCSEEEYQKEMADIKALVDEVEAEDIGMMMVVPNSCDVNNNSEKDQMREKIIRGMREIVEYANDKRVIITAENYGDEKYPVCTIDDVHYILEQVPGLRFCFDIGNFYCGNCDDLEAYETFRGNIVNVHMKDWEYAENGRYVLGDKRYTGSSIGSGFQHCGEIIQKLKADGYDGNLVIELNPLGSKKMIDESISFLKEII